MKNEILKAVLAWIACLLVLTGCATQQHPAYLKGQELLQTGQWEQGIAQMEVAAREDARDYQYRAAVIDARTQAVNELLRQAAASREAGQYSEAEATYRRILRIQPDESRTLSGLALTSAERRRGIALREAEAAFDKGDLRASEDGVRAVLSEAPRDQRAIALQRRIAERKPRPSTTERTPIALKRPITLQFRDANLRVILDVISRETGLSFVLDRDIRADLKASIFVKDTPIDEAVESILVSNGLAKKVMSETSILVYPNTPQKARDYQDLVIRNFYLQSADVKQMQTLLRTILKSRETFIDEKRNLLVMRDTPEMVRLAERLITAHDQFEPEVMLEVEVLEVGRNLNSALGAKFPDSISLGVADPTTLRNLNNLDASGVNITGLGSIVALNLKKLYSNVNLLANPRIRVRNKEKAKIHVGDRVPVISTAIGATTGISTQSVNYLDVGLKLEVEPQVLDSEVMIKIGLEVSSLGQQVNVQNAVAYQIGTRNTNTVLTLKDGETQILAGLINDNERETTNKLPGVGEMPLLGRLFSSSARTTEKTEIVLSITPRIIRRLERPSADLAEYWSGPESNLGGIGVSPVPGIAPAQPGGAPAVQPRAGITTGGFSGTSVVTPAVTPTVGGTVQNQAPAVQVPAPAPQAPAPNPSNPPPTFIFQPPPGVGG